MPHNIDHEPLLATHQTQLGLIMNEAASLDSKALGILAVIVAVLIFIAQAGLTFTAWWHLPALAAPFVLALLSCGVALWPRQYIGATPDIADHPENLSLSRDALILQLLVNTNGAIKHNNRLNSRRWCYVVLSVLLSLFGSAVLFAIL